MKKKLCYVISRVNYSVQFLDTEEHLDKSKYELTYIFLNPEEPLLFQNLKSKGREVFYIQYRGKKDLLYAIIKLRQTFLKLKPDIIHAHLFDASLAGLIAATAVGIKRRVFTRHHSIEAHVYHPHAVYYDKCINWLATEIVAISRVVYDVLIEREGVSANKIKIVPHGFNIETIKSSSDGVQNLRVRYDLVENYPVVGAISRFVHWKGVQYIIPAFKKLLVDFPDAKLVLSNAVGNYSAEIKSLLCTQLEENNYVLIEFEKQIFDLYQTFDAFVHVPINKECEAFGQTYVEALAMEIPSVFTLSGIANDFIKDKINALVVPYQDSEAIYKALKLLLTDTELRKSVVKQGKQDIKSLFDIKQMVRQLDKLYS